MANRTTGNNQLFKVTGSTRTALLTLSSALITDTEYHRLTVSYTGGEVVISQDGMENGRVTAVIPAGQFGLCSFNDAAYFDDFSLVPVSGGSVVTEAAGFPQGAEIAVYPNPFNPLVTIRVRGVGNLSLSVFDLHGKKVADLRRGNKQSVSGARFTELVTWDARNAPAGIYLIRARSGDKMWVKMCVLAK